MQAAEGSQQPRNHTVQCPLCESERLNWLELETSLVARTCGQCGGCWISFTDYCNWLDQHGEPLPEKPFSDVTFDVEDSAKAKRCPDCGRILVRFKVGHGIDFSLDHCGGCNGVWLDKNEWEVLKSRHLHDEIHRIFTTAWQKQVREEDLRRRLDRVYTEKFGPQTYGKLQRIRTWIDRHPRKSELLAFLNDPDPFAR